MINAFTLGPNEVVADNQSDSTVIRGAWDVVTDNVNSYGGDYLTASPAGIPASCARSSGE